MINASSISVSKILPALNIFDVYGIQKEDSLKSINIDPSVLKSPDNRFTADEVYKIFQETLRLTNNDNIGLCMGELLSKSFSSILGYVLMNCNTLGEAAEKYCSYEKIVDEASITEVQIDGSSAIVIIKTTSRILLDSRQFSDYKMSGLISYIKLLSGRTVTLKEANFTHHKPQDTSRYSKIFQCPVYFEKQANSLVFDKQILNLPIVEPNNNLLKLFENIAQETLKSLENNESYSKKVAQIILKEMNMDIPSIKAISRKLAISVRTLQTYLHQEQTSFTKIANEVRKEIALNCLKDKNVSIDEIAYVLGFSEASAFHRAFKKWTSLTPNEFRASVHS